MGGILIYIEYYVVTLFQIKIEIYLLVTIYRVFCIYNVISVYLI